VVRVKPLILAIVGKSGTGKSLMANYIEESYKIPMIRSYTDRPQRDKSDNGHTFLSKLEYKQLKEEDMIAHTNFGDNNYCCLFEDLSDWNTYVIDENGIMMLWNDERFDTVAIKLKRDKIDVDEARQKRDVGRFNIPDKEFDFIVYNNNSIEDFQDVIDFILPLALEGGSPPNTCTINGC
jgi:hypothetical protein